VILRDCPAADQRAGTVHHLRATAAAMLIAATSAASAGHTKTLPLSRPGASVRVTRGHTGSHGDRQHRSSPGQHHHRPLPPRLTRSSRRGAWPNGSPTEANPLEVQHGTHECHRHILLCDAGRSGRRQHGQRDRGPRQERRRVRRAWSGSPIRERRPCAAPRLGSSRLGSPPGRRRDLVAGPRCSATSRRTCWTSPAGWRTPPTSPSSPPAACSPGRSPI
jgi:hypothetical protein